MATQAQACIPPLDRQRPERTETALLALGCFWSPDARLGALPGVVHTSSGYAGGTDDAPTYRAIGDHTETVEVEFDPAKISYEEVLAVFWKSHDPTRQSWKRQYRSALFVLSDEQERAARKSKAQFDERLDAQVRTTIEPVERFFLAEDYHQNHRLRQHDAFERVYEQCHPDAVDFAHSPAASRVNGYLAGHGSADQLEREIGQLGLSEELQDELKRLHARRSKETAGQRLFG